MRAHPSHAIGALTGLLLVYLAQELLRRGELAHIIPAPIQQSVSLLANLAHPPESALLPLAALWLIAGAVFFALLSPDPEPITPTLAVEGGRHWTGLPLILVMTALIIYIIMLAGYLQGGESDWIRLAWWSTPILLILGAWLFTRRVQRARVTVAPAHLLWPAIILLVAAYTRFFHLPDIPVDIHGNVAVIANEARRWFHGEMQLVGVGLHNRPYLGFLPTALSLELFGDDLLGLRLGSAVLGVLSVWATYLLGRELFSRRQALLASWVLATAYVPIHFSRLGWPLAAETAGIWGLWALARGLRRGEPLSWAAGGVLLGLAASFSLSGRIMLLVAVIWLVWLGIMRRVAWAEGGRHVWLALLACLFVSGPGLVFAVQHPDLLPAEAAGALVWQEPVRFHLQDKYGVGSLEEVLRKQWERALLMFYIYSDSSSLYPGTDALLDRFVAPLVALGAGYALLRPRHPGHALLIPWVAFFLTLVAVAHDAPNWLLTLGIMPAIALLIGLALDRLIAALGSGIGAWFERSALMMAVGLIVIAGLHNWLDYYPLARHYTTEQTTVARFLIDLPPQTQVYIIPEGEVLNLHNPVLRLVVDGTQRLDLRTFSLDDLPRDLSATTVFILPRERQNQIIQVETAYPRGQRRLIQNREGGLIAVAYVAP